jgi:hypothetical protein
VSNVENPNTLLDQYMTASYNTLPTDGSSENTVNDDITKRITETRKDNIDIKTTAVGLYDVDSAIDYYFNEVLKPTVVENGEVIKVPAEYGSPERWSAMRKFGFYRDNKGKLVLPLIMYRQTGISNNDAIPIFRSDELTRTSKIKWDKKNSYDRFTVMNKSKVEVPGRYVTTKIPNYVILNYECVVWTAFIEQMNPLVEKINYTNNTYWGDMKKYKFRSVLEPFSRVVELEAETDRVVKTEFSISVYAYLLPKEFNGESTTGVSIGVKYIGFEERINTQ